MAAPSHARRAPSASRAWSRPLDVSSTAHLHARYQPIVRVCDGAFVAVEVLARLDDPERGMLFPAEFMPQMENAGLISDLTRAMIAIAFADHAACFASLGLNLALNIPRDLLLDARFAAWLETTRGAGGPAASHIILELTERQPVASLDNAGRLRLRRAFARLQLLGYRIAIDDFGPDMPGTAQVLSLPFDLLKLDKSMLQDSIDRQLMVQALACCRGRTAPIVAEGVESDSGWDRAIALGADHVQGFAVSRPMACDKVQDWARQWAARPHRA